MFGKKETPDRKDMALDSLIGDNIKVIGKIQGGGNLRIDGVVEGDIIYDGDIVIGEEGRVEGNISCDNVCIAGTVRGNVECNEVLNLLSTGKLSGDVQVSSFIVNENAIFEGNCKMEKGIEKVEELVKEGE
jgi:cytoskeletal protein CcmA (bactofilin family)